MAWYPARGGGIPASVKTDMNAVLNKKFGTISQDYPPTEWAADVNLLGKLPEKTASGSIAHFEDGADDVPLKSSKFYITPTQASGTPSPSNPLPISGRTGLNVYHSKTNLLRKLTVQDFSNGMVYGLSTYISIPLPYGQYTISTNAPTGFIWAGTATNINYNRVYSGTPNTFTINATYPTLLLGILTSNKETALSYDIQLELGSEATSYDEVTTYPISWSEQGTVYGGYFKDGELWKTHELIDLGTLEYTRLGTGTTGSYRFRATIDGKNADTGTGFAISNKMVLLATGKTYDADSDGFTIANGYIYIFLDDFKTDSVAQFTSDITGFEVCYELATPVKVADLEEVEITSLLGVNNIWTDAGDSEVEYRADIDLLLAALGGGNRSLNLMQAPSISEQEETEEEQEATENER